MNEVFEVSGRAMLTPATMSYWLQQLFYFAQIASFQLPLAIAFALTQGITRRIFLSYGDLAMFASFGAIYVLMDGMLHGLDDWASALMSLCAAVACGAALGIIVARVFTGNRLLAAPLAFMIASVGITMIIQETMRISTNSQNVWSPPLFEGRALWEANGLAPRFSLVSVWSITAALLSVFAIWAVLAKTRFGLHWQACSQSPFMAALCGVNALAIATTTYALAGALAGITGWTSAVAYGGASFASGLIIGFKAMFASVIGGFGTLRGAVIGTLVFTAIEVLWSAFFGTSYRDVAVFLIVTACLVLKPEGLTGVSSERHG
jgi:branched-chain amino acid transport system permease protein